ncbi:dephospho-CoA kinase [Runella slithyformis]|uniref:Dephospho-CoA kinase n=1 Tax=Runella slithyformis (strain ATCC 29530 / DSM 19594 / LMG 11500 / NCIMB 11436 / LSU 4) TaxID=761193 RepID=A0A7U3ZLU7_RUNSL|nr:dephospho-CoA kinase [Runella slithyformis]AEI49560.1 Dephospho-CoA kinase [Runella slithyformis DSM 19594]
MLQIGVTGGIGSGKSMVCRIFSALGVPVYYADERAKWLLNHDHQLQRSVIELLGNEAYTANSTYNRAWVASQVFQNPSLLQQLNAIVHPRVREDTEAWMKQNAAAPYVVKEAAIMAKAGQNNALDKVIVVDAPVALRVTRVLQRDPQRSEKEIRDIIARQISDKERRQIADYVIYNDESKLLIPQVWKLHLLFKK